MIHIHDAAFKAAEGVADVEGEAETLHDEELGSNDVFCRCVSWDFFGELAQGHVEIVGLGCKEESAGHDCFRRVGHWRVAEVESTDVLNRSGLLERRATLVICSFAVMRFNIGRDTHPHCCRQRWLICVRQLYGLFTIKPH